MSDEAADAQRALNAARDRRRRAAMGPVLQQSDADLDALSQVGPHDLGAVEAFIREAAGQVGVDLFRAEPSV
jgi:hypothetical protein